MNHDYFNTEEQRIGERLLAVKKELDIAKRYHKLSKYNYIDENTLSAAFILTRYKRNVIRYGRKVAESKKLTDIDTFSPGSISN